MLGDGKFSLVVYHITIAENVRGIHELGILPSMAKGKMGASWYVSLRNVEWAAIHVMNDKLVTPHDLYVCATMTNAEDMYKFFRPGFYYTYTVYHPESITPFMFFLHNERTFSYE